MKRLYMAIRSALILRNSSCSNCGSCSVVTYDGKTFTCMDCNYQWTVG